MLDSIVVKKNDYLPKLISRLFDTFITLPATFLLFTIVADLETEWRGILFVANFVIPFIFFLFLRISGRVSDIDLSNRKERYVWFSMAALFWVINLAWLTVFQIDLPSTIRFFQLWLVVWGVCNVLITFVWKISGHAMLTTNLIFWLVFFVHPVFSILYITLLPIVGWSRVALDKHNWRQISGGVGFVLLLNIAFLRMTATHSWSQLF